MTVSGWDDRPAEAHADRKTIDRIERRFRGHVQTRSNPKGRIVRQPCVFCDFPAAEAHHLSYDPAWAFIVVWSCVSCHRRVEYGSLKVRQKHICDYSSLVRNICLPGAYRENRREPNTSFDFGFNVAQESK